MFSNFDCNSCAITFLFRLSVTFKAATYIKNFGKSLFFQIKLAVYCLAVMYCFAFFQRAINTPKFITAVDQCVFFSSNVNRT